MLGARFVVHQVATSPASASKSLASGVVSRLNQRVFSVREPFKLKISSTSAQTGTRIGAIAVIAFLSRSPRLWEAVGRAGRWRLAARAPYRLRLFEPITTTLNRQPLSARVDGSEWLCMGHTTRSGTARLLGLWG